MLMISRISYAFPSTLLSRDRAIVCGGGEVAPNQLVPAGGVDLGPGRPFTRCNRIATGPHTGRGARTAGLVGDRTRTMTLLRDDFRDHPRAHRPAPLPTRRPHPLCHPTPPHQLPP